MSPISASRRLAAGVFPLVLHVAVAGPAVGADMLYALSRGMVGLHLDINIINTILVMLVAPGAALLLGVLPFARMAERVGFGVEGRASAARRTKR